MQLKYTTTAVDDLVTILDTIAKDSPKRAEAYVLKIKDAIELLQIFPNLGVSCKSKGIERDCRVMVFEAYLVFYTIKEKIIIINTIIHASHNI